jgi:hypothetical protein
MTTATPQDSHPGPSPSEKPIFKNPRFTTRLSRRGCVMESPLRRMPLPPRLQSRSTEPVGWTFRPPTTNKPPQPIAKQTRTSTDASPFTGLLSLAPLTHNRMPTSSLKPQISVRPISRSSAETPCPRKAATHCENEPYATLFPKIKGVGNSGNCQPKHPNNFRSASALASVAGMKQDRYYHRRQPTLIGCRTWSASLWND